MFVGNGGANRCRSPPNKPKTIFANISAHHRVSTRVHGYLSDTAMMMVMMVMLSIVTIMNHALSSFE